MKKIISASLALGLCMSVSACGGDTREENRVPRPESKDEIQDLTIGVSTTSWLDEQKDSAVVPETIEGDWFGWIEYAYCWGDMQEAFLSAWADVYANGDGRWYFEVYADGNSLDPVVSFWCLNEEGATQLFPDVDGADDAWVLDTYITQEEADAFTDPITRDNSLSYSFNYVRYDGSAGCTIYIFMRRDGVYWNENTDRLPPRYEEYKEALDALQEEAAPAQNNVPVKGSADSSALHAGEPDSVGPGNEADAILNSIPLNKEENMNKEVTFVFTKIPETVEELMALPEATLDTPFKTTALSLLALLNYEKDPELAYAMLDALRGPDPLSPYTKSFLNDRLRGKCYKVRSFFAGATPQNNYTPTSPWTITVQESPYSYPEENWATLYVASGGADSPRPIKLRRKPSENKWYLNDLQCLSDIRTPVEADPWA